MDAEGLSRKERKDLIEKQLREYLHAYLVEEGAYTCLVESQPDDGGPYYATFTSTFNGNKIVIDRIYFDDGDRLIIQHDHAEFI